MVALWLLACFLDDNDLDRRLDRDQDGWESVDVGGEDCDDADSGISPGSRELLDGIDNDCSGTTDDLSVSGTPHQWQGEVLGAQMGTSLAVGDPLGLGQQQIWATSPGWTAAKGEAPAGQAAAFVPGEPDAVATLAGETGVQLGDTVLIDDLDHDGIDDIIISSRIDATAWLFYGPVDATSTTDADAHWLLDDGGAGRNRLAVGRITGDETELIVGLSVLADGESTPGGLLFFDLASESEPLHLLGGTDLGQLGYSVAVADLDGDGQDDVVTGAPSERDGNGVVHLVSGPWDGLTERIESLSVELNGGKSESLGFSLHATDEAHGDVDGDGYADLLVGAPTALDGEKGAVRIYLGPLAENTPAEATLLGEVSPASLGEYVAFVGDVRGDGGRYGSVGAPGMETLAYRGGAVTLVDLTDASGTIELSEVAVASVEGPTLGASLGVTAHAGDLDDNGVDDWLVAARFEDGEETSMGAVFLFLAEPLR